MTSLRGHHLERPDATIHFWTAGSEAAPTVLFLHGATLDHCAQSVGIETWHDILS